MKKLFTLLLCSIIFTFPVVGMEKIKDDVSVPENFPNDCKRKILINYFAQNVHNYIKNYYENDDSYSHYSVGYVARITGRIIGKISFINWEFYKALDKERNDPVTTRTMLKNIVVTYYPTEKLTELGIVHALKSPGAKKCIQLSDALFGKRVTPKKIKKLFNEGAFLNYFDEYKKSTVLSYWVGSNTKRSTAIVGKLLQLGANPNVYCKESSPLHKALSGNNIEKIKLLLHYKAIKEWYIALVGRGYQRFIDIFIANSTNDELNDGLIVCCKFHPYLPEIMQKFIDSGASPSVALPHIFEQTINSINCLTPDHTIIQKFYFLCDQQAYDSTIFDKMQNLQTIFSVLTNKLEHNKLLEF